MAILKKISIEHYRGFYDKQNLEFAIPNGKTGSGLTLIVGPNNTGKTTLLECLLFDHGKRFRKTERHGTLTPKIAIESDKGEAEFTNLSGGSEVSATGNHEIQFEIIPSRRYWDSYSSGYTQPLEFVQQTRNRSIRNADTQDIASVLKQINRTPSQKDAFNSYLKIIIPHFTDWTIESEQNDYVLYRTATGEHIANLSGDGIISIFRICAHLIADLQQSVLIIDEPELSLHPSAQKALAKLISQASKDKQLIVCTHSPYFANWDDYINGAKFVRLNKPDDKQCEICWLDDKKSYSSFIGNNIADWQRPQLLDLAAKEVLFADKVLFTEGQEDVGLIRKWLHSKSVNIDFDIFGYGVGGYTNMKLFLELAKDLSLSKVAALYDAGEESKKAYNQDKKDYPDFKLMILPTEDIRDREKTIKGKVKQYEGCFDESGNLKSARQAEFETIMNDIIFFFN